MYLSTLFVKTPQNYIYKKKKTHVVLKKTHAVFGPFFKPNKYHEKESVKEVLLEYFFIFGNCTQSV